MFIEFLIFGLCPWCECVGSIEWVAVWVVWMSATYSVSFVTANKPHWFLPLSLFTVTRLKTRPDSTRPDCLWRGLNKTLTNGTFKTRFWTRGQRLGPPVLFTQNTDEVTDSLDSGGSKTKYSEYSDHQKYKTRQLTSSQSSGVAVTRPLRF